MKLPTRSLAFLVGGLMLGTALAPVGAQQIAPADGQLAVRSDGAVYLIYNAQRRWVPTVQITDEELNAYPEGEPIYAGLAPMGAQTTAASPARVTASPAAATTAGTAATGGATGATGTTAAAGSATATPTTTTGTTSAGTTASTGTTVAPSSDINPELPLEVDIEGPAKFEPGERIIVNVKSKIGAACELTVQWPAGREAPQDTKAADSRGRCRYSIEIADNAPTGVGFLKGSVREAGRVSRQDIEFEIVPKN